MIYYLKVRDRENWGENLPVSFKDIPPMKIFLITRIERVVYDKNPSSIII